VSYKDDPCPEQASPGTSEESESYSQCCLKSWSPAGETTANGWNACGRYPEEVVYWQLAGKLSTRAKTGQRCGTQNKMFMQGGAAQSMSHRRRDPSSQSHAGRCTPYGTRGTRFPSGTWRRASYSCGIRPSIVLSSTSVRGGSVCCSMHQPITSCSTGSSFLKPWNVPPVALRSGSMYRRVDVASTCRESELGERHSIKGRTGGAPRSLKPFSRTFDQSACT
jgi:hypothetical protein